jgi:hypothetical protein
MCQEKFGPFMQCGSLIGFCDYIIVVNRFERGFLAPSSWQGGILTPNLRRLVLGVEQPWVCHGRSAHPIV